MSDKDQKPLTVRRVLIWIGDLTIGDIGLFILALALVVLIVMLKNFIFH